MKSSKDNEYLLTGNHTVTTSWWRTARCSNSDNNWQLSISHCHLMMDLKVLWQWQQSTAVNQSINQSTTVTWWWTARCSDNDNNQQLSTNQSLSLDDGSLGALTMTTIDSCQSINHCYLMMDRQVLWQWQQSTAVNQSINHCHLMSTSATSVWQCAQHSCKWKKVVVTATFLEGHATWQWRRWWTLLTCHNISRLLEILLV